MKITKRQLKRIIKEERAKILNEIRRPMTAEADTLEFALDEYIKERVLIGETDQQRINDEIRAVLDNLWDDIEMKYGEIDQSRWS